MGNGSPSLALIYCVADAKYMSWFREGWWVWWRGWYAGGWTECVLVTQEPLITLLQAAAVHRASCFSSFSTFSLFTDLHHLFISLQPDYISFVSFSCLSCISLHILFSFFFLSCWPTIFLRTCYFVVLYKECQWSQLDHCHYQLNYNFL